jgi:hypothetical protein
VDPEELNPEPIRGKTVIGTSVGLAGHADFNAIGTMDSESAMTLPVPQDAPSATSDPGQGTMPGSSPDAERPTCDGAARSRSIHLVVDGDRELDVDATQLHAPA